jgi:RimJ/RimL family protein N-acetyltransferase
MSRHLNVKERGAFERDLKRVIFFDPPPLFFVEEGIRKAYFFFKPAEVGVEISFNVAPSQRGKGVATRALKEVISWLKTRQVEAVVAFVKVDNQISKTLLKKAGFDEVSFKEVFLEDTGELISMYELILNRGSWIKL